MIRNYKQQICLLKKIPKAGKIEMKSPLTNNSQLQKVGKESNHVKMASVL